MMSREQRQHFDVLVIGGGPAGQAAAVCAAESGVRVGIVDDNPSLGGQIWRAEAGGPQLDQKSNGQPNTPAAKWAQRLRASGAEVLCGLRVVDQPEERVLLAEGSSGFRELEYEKLVLATGARERFLPFPGWTLPNVMGAGGLQAMVKSGLPIRGKRVVVAGTGPLLLAVAAYLRKHGAQIPLICEQVSWISLARLSAALFTFPKKIAQAFELKKELAGIPLATATWPIEAQGTQKLESVTIVRNGKHQTIPCDYLACGFHLVPNLELPILLGCRIENGYVQVDDFQQTTVPGTYCAGEPIG